MRTFFVILAAAAALTTAACNTMQAWVNVSATGARFRRRR
jgi:hypothetical protein